MNREIKKSYKIILKGEVDNNIKIELNKKEYELIKKVEKKSEEAFNYGYGYLPTLEIREIEMFNLLKDKSK